MTNTNTPTSPLGYVRKFFEAGRHRRKVVLDELKALSKEDREELGRLAKRALEEEGGE